MKAFIRAFIKTIWQLLRKTKTKTKLILYMIYIRILLCIYLTTNPQKSEFV